MKYFFLIFFLVSCGKPHVNDYKPGFVIDEKLNKYVEEFLQEAAHYNRPLAVPLSDLRIITFQDDLAVDQEGAYVDQGGEGLSLTRRLTTLGVCHAMRQDRGYVNWGNVIPEEKELRVRWKELNILTPSKWPFAYSEEVMKALMFHELGHCLFNLDHPEGNHIGNKEKYVIMNEQLNTSSEFWNNNWDRLVKELMTEAK